MNKQEIHKAIQFAREQGFQKGKLEERNRIEDLIIDMRFKIQNRLNNYFNIDTRTLLFIYNKELSQLQKEIGDNSQQSLGIGSLGKGTSDEGLHNPNSYVSNSPNSHPEKSRNELDTACLGLNKTNSGSDTKEIGGMK